jgi:putative nucleotidyltransferase with HDIG domain
MAFDPFLTLLLLISLSLAGAAVYVILFIHRLNRAVSHFKKGDFSCPVPKTSLPILSAAAGQLALLSNTLRDLQKMEQFQQKMLAYEKEEMAHLLEKENLARQLENQLKETQLANETISILNRDLEEINVSLNEAINRLSALNQISKVMGMEHDKRQIYRMAVSLPAELLQAQIGHLLLLDEERNELNLEFSKGLPNLDQPVRRSYPVGLGLAGWVAENRKPLLVEDFSSQDTFLPTSMMGYERHTAIAAPLMIREELIGVISLVNRESGLPFTEDEKTLLTTIASETAMAIHNTLLLEKIQKNYFSMVQSLIVAVEAKDVYTRGHSERVTRYSVLIAEQMGLTLEQMEIIQQAGVLHDIGKITVELSILNKPGALDMDELDKIKLHPLIGYRILEPIDFDDRIKKTVLQHHERPDGKGYPEGRSGDEILMEARILAAADAFDAMTTERPYRDPMGIEEALQEMEAHSGTQFDPDVVGVLSRIVRSMTNQGVDLMVG